MTTPRLRKSALPITLLFLILVADGFDTSSLAVLVPTLAGLWGTSPSAFTLPIVLTNVGVVIGCMACGRLTARFGKANVVKWSVVLYSLGVIATVLVTTIPGLSVVRLVTGLGLGLVLPAAISLATDLVSPRRRGATAVVMALALGVGIMLSGLTAAPIMAGLGWGGIFWVPGVVAMILAAMLWVTLPNVAAPNSALADAPIEGASVRALFAGGLALRTSLLWTLSFLVFATSYVLQSWLPTFLLDYGFGPAQAPLGTAAYGMGGIVGGLILTALTVVLRAPQIVTIMLGFGVVLLAVLSTAPLGVGIILLVIAAAGAGITAGPMGQAALAVGLYEGGTRTTGVAWAAAMGRIGSIVGPAASGALLALEVAPARILLFTVIPLLLATLAAATFALVGRKRRSNGTAATATTADLAPALPLVHKPGADQEIV